MVRHMFAGCGITPWSILRTFLKNSLPASLHMVQQLSSYVSFSLLYRKSGLSSLESFYIFIFLFTWFLDTSFSTLIPLSFFSLPSFCYIQSLLLYPCFFKRHFIFLGETRSSRDFPCFINSSFFFSLDLRITSRKGDSFTSFKRYILGIIQCPPI